MAVPVLFYKALLCRFDPNLAEAVAPFDPCFQVVRLLLLHWVVLVHGGVVRQCAAACAVIKKCLDDIIRLQGYTDLYGFADLPPMFAYPLPSGEDACLCVPCAQAALAAAATNLSRLTLVLAFGHGWLQVWVLWALSMVLTTYNAAADAILPLAAAPVVPKQLLWGLYVFYGLVAAGPIYRGIMAGPRFHEGVVGLLVPAVFEFGFLPHPAMLRADAMWADAAAAGSACMYGVMSLCAVALPVVCGVAALALLTWLVWGCLQLGIDSLVAGWIRLQSVWLELKYALSVLFQAAYSSAQLRIAWLLQWPVVAWRSLALVINAVVVQPVVAVPDVYRRSVSTSQTMFGYFTAVPSAAHTHLHTHHQSSKETLQEGVTPVDRPSSGRLWVLLLGAYLGVAAVLVMQALWAKRQVLLHRLRVYSSTAPPTSAAAAGGAQDASTAAGSSAGMQQDLREVDPAVECIACQEAVRTVCLRPCGHVVLCAACFDTISKCTQGDCWRPHGLPYLPAGGEAARARLVDCVRVRPC